MKLSYSGLPVIKFWLCLLVLIGITSLSAEEWQFKRCDDIYYWTAPKDTAYAAILVKRLHKRIDDFQLRLGVYPDKPLYLKIIPDIQTYRDITQGKGSLVQSSEAFYSPRENLIYAKSPDQIPPASYDYVLMHEYIHFFLEQTMSSAPLWFHEGMAVYYSGQFGFQSYIDFSRYRFLGIRLSISNMTEDYPKQKGYWEMFYLTSAFAVQYLDAKHNEQWQQFWNIIGYYYNRPDTRMLRRIDFNSVFYAAFKTSLYTFSKDFDKATSRYAWQFPLIGINAVIFGLLPFVVLLAWLKGRKKLRSMPDLPCSSDEEDCLDIEADPMRSDTDIPDKPAEQDADPSVQQD